MKKRVAIIGGGASGAIVATHLAKSLKSQISISIFEPNLSLGQGQAYGNNDPEDLLNVPAKKMSLDPEVPDDFEYWLSLHRTFTKESKHWPFVPRSLFAQYLESRIPPDLNHIKTQVKAIKKRENTFLLTLACGTQDIFDFVILATGYQSPQLQFDFKILKGDILILGSGLSALDYWRRLRRQQDNWRKSRIHFLSRRGLLPRPHNLKIEIQAKNFKYLQRSPRMILKEFRNSEIIENGIEHIRSQAGNLWRSWTPSQRKSFLTHLKPYWEMIRHRVPPTIYEELMEDFSAKKVQLTAGRVTSVTQKNGKYEVQLDTRNGIKNQTLIFDHILKATGYEIDQSIQIDPELKIEKCPFGFGYSQIQSSHFWILGPAQKAQDWETTSIPDISLKAQEISKHIKQILNSEPML